MRIRRYAKLSLPVAAVVFLSWILLAQQPRRVDDALLKTGSRNGEERVAHGVNWAEQRYSPLDQINVSNVSRLGVAWSYEIPLASGNPQTHIEATPLWLMAAKPVAVGVVEPAAAVRRLLHVLRI